MDNIDVKICSNCGASNPPIHKFCSQCGEGLTPKTCPKCGAPYEREQKFCGFCGALLDKPKQGQTAATVASENSSEGLFFQPQPQVKPIRRNPIRLVKAFLTSDKKRGRRIIRDGSLMLIAVILFILSFMPVVKIDFINRGYYNYGIQLSPVHFITFMSDNAKHYSDNEIMDLYDKRQELSIDLDEALKEDYNEYTDKLAISSNTKKLARQFYICAQRCNIANGNLAPGDLSALIITGIVSLFYILFSIGFAAVAVLNFVFGIQRKKDLFKPIAVLFSVFLGFSLTVLFTGRMFLVSNYSSISVAGSFIALLFFSVLGLGLTFFFTLFGKGRAAVKKAIPQMLTVAVIVTIIGAMFAPMLSVNAKLTLKGRLSPEKIQINLDSDVFYDMMIMDLHKDIISNINGDTQRSEKITEIYSALEQYTKTEIKRGNALDVAKSAVIYSFMLRGGYRVSSLFVIVNLMLVLIGLMSTVFLGVNTAVLMGGKRRAVCYTLKALIIVCALIVLAMCIVVAGVSNSAYEKYSLDDYHIGVQAGSILITVLAIGFAFCPTRFKDKSKIGDIEEWERCINDRYQQQYATGNDCAPNDYAPNDCAPRNEFAPDNDCVSSAEPQALPEDDNIIN